MLIYQLIMSDILLHEVAFFPIEKAMRKLKEYTVSKFKEHDFPVTKDQWIVLKKISEEQNQTQRKIAEETFKEPAALTRILDILEKKGLVKRTASAIDRRTFEINLSVDGQRLVAKMIPVVQDIRKQALKGINKTQIEEIKRLMNAIHDNLV